MWQTVGRLRLGNFPAPLRSGALMVAMTYHPSLDERPDFPRRVSVNVAAIDRALQRATEAETRGDLGDALLLHSIARMCARPAYAAYRRPRTGPGGLG